MKSVLASVPVSSIRYTRGPPTLGPPYRSVSAPPSALTDTSSCPAGEVWFDAASSATRFRTGVQPDFVQLEMFRGRVKGSRRGRIIALKK